MLKEKRELVSYLKSKCNSLVFNQKKLNTVITEIEAENGVPTGIVMDIIAGRTDMEEDNEFLLFLNIDQWYNTRQANESGIINFIKQGMKQYGLSFHDYLWSEHLKEVEFQYDRRIVRSSFYTKYKNLFE